MKYFILNIKHNKKSEVDHWLGEKELAPIFYGKLTLRDLIDNTKLNEELRKRAGYNIRQQDFNEAKKFVEIFKEINKEVIVFSIGNKHIYIFQQDGSLHELPEDEQHKNDN